MSGLRPEHDDELERAYLKAKDLEVRFNNELYSRKPSLFQPSENCLLKYDVPLDKLQEAVDQSRYMIEGRIRDWKSGKDEKLDITGFRTLEENLAVILFDDKRSVDIKRLDEKYLQLSGEPAKIIQNHIGSVINTLEENGVPRSDYAEIFGIKPEKKEFWEEEDKLDPSEDPLDNQLQEYFASYGYGVEDKVYRNDFHCDTFEITDLQLMQAFALSRERIDNYIDGYLKWGEGDWKPDLYKDFEHNLAEVVYGEVTPEGLEAVRDYMIENPVADAMRREFVTDSFRSAYKLPDEIVLEVMGKKEDVMDKYVNEWKSRMEERLQEEKAAAPPAEAAPVEAPAAPVVAQAPGPMSR